MSRSEEMIVYNTTDSVIFITTKFQLDLVGGPAKSTVEYSITPGQGIDLSIIGLEPKKKLIEIDDSPMGGFK